MAPVPRCICRHQKEAQPGTVLHGLNEESHEQPSTAEDICRAMLTLTCLTEKRCISVVLDSWPVAATLGNQQHWRCSQARSKRKKSKQSGERASHVFKHAVVCTTFWCSLSLTGVLVSQLWNWSYQENLYAVKGPSRSNIWIPGLVYWPILKNIFIYSLKMLYIYKVHFDYSHLPTLQFLLATPHPSSSQLHVLCVLNCHEF